MTVFWLRYLYLSGKNIEIVWKPYQIKNKYYSQSESVKNKSKAYIFLVTLGQLKNHHISCSLWRLSFPRFLWFPWDLWEPYSGRSTNRKEKTWRGREKAQLNKNNCIMLLNFINVTEHVRFLYIVCSLKWITP